VRDLAVDHRTAGLDSVDVAVMDLADKVAADATSVTEGDVRRLRDLEVTGPIARLRSNFINGIKHTPVRVELTGRGT